MGGANQSDQRNDSRVFVRCRQLHDFASPGNVLIHSSRQARLGQGCTQHLPAVTHH